MEARQTWTWTQVFTGNEKIELVVKSKVVSQHTECMVAKQLYRKDKNIFQSEGSGIAKWVRNKNHY